MTGVAIRVAHVMERRAPDDPSPRVRQAAALFGLDGREARTDIIIPPSEIPIPLPGIIFITGPSGGGKTTLLRAIEGACIARSMHVIDFNRLPPLPAEPLVDLLGGSLEEATKLLSLAGLADAALMLQRPGDLSAGQLHRLRLAQAMQLSRAATAGPEAAHAIILADEFTASLDRITAQTIGRNVRRWIGHATDRPGCCFIAATTHDDLLEALEPDVLVWKGMGEQMEVHGR